MASDALRVAHRSGNIVGCVLERLAQAVVLVDERAAVGGLNQPAAAIVAEADGLSIHHGILRCRCSNDTGALHRLIGDAAARRGCGGSNACGGLRIQRSMGRRPLTALVTVLHEDACRSLPGAIAVFVNDPERVRTIDVEMLRKWYELTPAEARVAALLATGLSLDDIAGRLRIGANTGRTHLKSIFAKTDTRRQGELIRLLLSNPMLSAERN